ncbi:PKD domain protein [Tenacibaculum jejuense]|uniref:PKD domain containing lipoprotein n=1 Tax=Tenacibaculum jejuense TaxID=584609 RepID=A0A238UBU4_9FLAO|nr:PKD domain protein [Tenacibaculum jejuense]SNR16456.1 PKD domain containing lipoprotein precursor [Tenacibaculum jejuense]
MKKIHYIILGLLVLVGCIEEDRDLSFADNLVAPTNVAATYSLSQDNSGLVTITPTADGANSFKVYFGDGTNDFADVAVGQSVDRTYGEGTYMVKIEAFNISGKKSEAIQELVVSFKAPENLMVTIENSTNISKQVDVTTTADYATMYEFYSGESGVSQPVATANIGESLSYVYQALGDYDIRVVAKGAAIATTEYTATFTVTEILAPTIAAATPINRVESDVISLFSDAYTDVSVDTWNTVWSAASFEDVMIVGNATKKYTGLNFNGIETVSSPVDASGMEFIHLDVWTPNITAFRLKLVDFKGDGFGGAGDTEAELSFTPTQGEWVSLDIPLSDFAAAGMDSFSDINQYIISSDPSGAGIVFIDNVYFWKSPTDTTSQTVEGFEGTAPIFTSFGGAGVEVVSNPDMSGVNTTANVARLTKGSGSEVWAGGFFEISTPLDLATFSKISVKTWSPKQGALVKLKLENQDASVTHEVDVNTTVANAWEELIYDFSGAPTADYVRIVIFFDFGVNGEGSEYYYDDIILVNDSEVSPLVFQDFEVTAPTFTSFGNIAGVEVITNPDMSGVNTTSNVAKLTKTSGSEVWAGAFFETDTALDFTTYSKISVKTWSPKQGAVVKLKLENQDASITHEVDLNTTVSNSWEELIYDFSGAPAGDYVRVVIFFDFGVNGDDSVYYYDELTLTN